MNINDISDLAKLDTKAMIAKILELQKANAAQAKALADANKPRAITMKVSEKGALSLYGLQRMPVTLYAAQWERLLDQAPAIRAFIAANPTLARK